MRQSAAESHNPLCSAIDAYPLLLDPAHAAGGSTHERGDDDEEIGDDAQKRLPDLAQPMPLDTEAEQPLRTNDLGCRRAKRRSAEPGDDLLRLDRAGESEPEQEKRREPREPGGYAPHASPITQEPERESRRRDPPARS